MFIGRKERYSGAKKLQKVFNASSLTHSKADKQVNHW